MSSDTNGLVADGSAVSDRHETVEIDRSIPAERWRFTCPEGHTDFFRTNKCIESDSIGMSDGYKDQETLQRLYVEEGLTQAEIGDKFDVSQTTIGNWIEKHGIEKEQPPWRDEAVLQSLYWGEELSIGDIADELDTSRDVIHRWMDRLGVERRPGPQTERPWHDEKTLRELYFKEGLTQTEIAERFGTTQGVISEWFVRHDIETPSWYEAGKEARRVNRAYFRTDEDGYEIAGSRVGETTKMVPIHRLVALAEHGLDAVAENVVHHKNGIKWDNRPENLEVMKDAAHKSQHAKKGDYHEQMQ